MSDTPATPTATPYDELPYPGWSGVSTHPNRLAVTGRLFGLTPADITRCRVLELACASGANLIPMAYALPGSTFVGVDASRVQVDAGNANIRALGLQNIELQHRNILEITAADGPFDYIIAHGVFSWVPREVQEQILNICRQCLAPQGVAYISYNTMPGWHSLRMIREIMLYHTREFKDPRERIAEAKAVLKFVAGLTPEGAEPGHSQTLREHYRYFEKRPDAYIYHELLAENNQPEYFHEFVARARQHQLEYLAEATLQEMQGAGLDREIREQLQKHNDRVVVEQYFDFLLNRRFRKTLLCHRERQVYSQPDGERLAEMRVLGMGHPVSESPDLTSYCTEEFKTERGSSACSSHPIDKTALALLAQESPRSVPFEELLTKVRERLAAVRTARGEPDSVTADRARLLNTLLPLYVSGIVELEVCEYPFVPTISERPMASAVARRQAQFPDHMDAGLRGQGAEPVNNLRHQTVSLTNAVTQRVLPLADGTRDHEALLAELIATVQRGDLVVEEGGQRVLDAGELRRILTPQLKYSLSGLAGHALLVG